MLVKQPVDRGSMTWSTVVDALVAFNKGALLAIVEGTELVEVDAVTVMLLFINDGSV